MQITLFISNRQSGKTTIAYYQFLKDPEHTMLFSPGNKHLPKNKNILPCENFEIVAITARQRKVNKIIIDNYFDLSPKQMEEFIYFIDKLDLTEVSLFTTAKLYQGEIIELIKDSKLNNYNLEPSLYGRAEVLELLPNLITDPRTVVINEKFFLNKHLAIQKDLAGLSDESSFTGVYKY